ncbi:MAG: hypothetical protein ACXV4C_10875 [Halobacteriota archaeon]
MGLEHAQLLAEDIKANLTGNYDKETRLFATQAELLLDLIEEIRGLLDDLDKLNLTDRAYNHVHGC